MVYMKVTHCFVAFILLTMSFSQDINPNYSYQDFQIQFGRSYTGQERQGHKLEFLKSYTYFLQKRKTNPNIEVNTFFDWNETQKQNFFNYKPNMDEAKPQPLRSSLSVSTPSSFDYRTLGKVSPVKDQGGCGSCWAFSASAVFQSFLLIQQNKLYDIAEQYTLECDKSSFACGGGYPFTALALMNQTGAPLQTQYPYKQQSPYFSNNSATPICSNTAGYIKVKNVTRVQYISGVTDNFLINQLLTYGPVSIGICGGCSSFSWAGSTGIIDDCATNSPIDHAVQLIGYTDTHWIIKNSWGTWWGNNGFGYVKRSADCGIKSYVSLFQAIYNNNNNSNNTVPTTANITIKMISTTANGWGGWILGFKQNGIIVNNFTLWDGANGTKYVSLQPSAYAQVIVVQYGWGPTGTVIGFQLLYDNGVSIFKRVAGQTIANGTIFTTFCPTANCVVPVSVKQAKSYQVQLTNSWGNGYQGTILQFRQGTNFITVGEQFTNGNYFGPISLNIVDNQHVIVVPKKLGQYRQHISFKVTDSNGKVVANWNSGNSFGADSILASFCPNCPQITTQQQQYKLSKLQIGLISSLTIICVIAFSLIISMIILCKKLKGKQVEVKQVEVNQREIGGESAGSIVKRQNNQNGSSTVSVLDRNT